MKLFTGWAVLGALILAASAAQAQGLAPNDPGRPRYLATSDVAGPYGAMPMEAPPPRYGYGPAYGYGPPPAYDYGGPTLMPPQEVYTVLRENGFSPLGIPHQRGRVYVISVLDRSGEDGRLFIDARDGRIIRFVPAFRSGGYYDGGYPPYGGPPVPPADIRGALPPGASGPRMASRSVPLPSPKPKSAELASTPQAGPAKPAAPVAEPKQQSAAVVEKDKPAAPPAAAQAAPAPSPPVEAKPAAVIQPTQEMPKVQGLE